MIHRRVSAEHFDRLDRRMSLRRVYKSSTTNSSELPRWYLRLLMNAGWIVLNIARQFLNCLFECDREKRNKKEEWEREKKKTRVQMSDLLSWLKEETINRYALEINKTIGQNQKHGELHKAIAGACWSVNWKISGVSLFLTQRSMAWALACDGCLLLGCETRANDYCYY